MALWQWLFGAWLSSQLLKPKAEQIEEALWNESEEWEHPDDEDFDDLEEEEDWDLEELDEEDEEEEW